MKKITTLFSFLCLCASVFAQIETACLPLDDEPKRLPPSTKNDAFSEELSKFIPKGYAILDQKDGDLNHDGRPDKVLILNALSKNEQFKTYQRPVFLLIRQANGKLKRVSGNGTLLLAKNMGGDYPDPYHGITIKNGYFSIEHFVGEEVRWNYVVTFKYTPEQKDWLLHKIGREWWHKTNPKKYNKAVLTKADFGEIRFKNFQHPSPVMAY